MTTKEMIEVMQAYLDGKKIEVKHKYSTKWRTLNEPKWCFIDYDYKIKNYDKNNKRND